MAPSLAGIPWLRRAPAGGSKESIKSAVGAVLGSPACFHSAPSRKAGSLKIVCLI